MRNPWPRMPHPDVLGYGGRDYGNRVGLWRMFEVLDKHNIRCTVSLSMSVIEMYPEILEAMEARRWEYMSHGYFNTRYHWGYEEQEEREVIEHSKATHLRLTGRKLDQKLYVRHSGEPGGFRTETYGHLLERKPELPIQKAVKGMLPKNILGRELLTKLKVYAGPDHPHAAQKPEPLAWPQGQK